MLKSNLMALREINTSEIEQNVAELCLKANFRLGEDVIKALQDCIDKEQSPVGRETILQLIDNARLSLEKSIPLCQDCGAAVIFVEIGQDVHINGGNLSESITRGVKEGYRAGYLRKSMVCKPFSERINTADNTPPIIHYDIVPGDRLRIIMMPKGGGAENMSRVSMLSPGDGEGGIISFIEDTVKNAGGAPCPPIIIGVGIGGTLEKAALMAKKALVRPVGESSPDPELACLEEKILNRINCLGIGPLGMGGTSTALAVHAVVFPCHMASLPVAVNLQCHSSRHAEVML
ncbi:MAG: fumarate hydratase [Dehalococcoidales bacterium]|nr:fumarate hydratase [Dehalococcoidales bacterium]MDX9985993.1 fumarate hydratase [Dehalococcoidales bacterium]